MHQDTQASTFMTRTQPRARRTQSSEPSFGPVQAA